MNIRLYSEINLHNCKNNIIETPDKFGIGNWSVVDEWGWSPSGALGDSGYSLWWNERTITSGNNFSVNTIYGIQKSKELVKFKLFLLYNLTLAKNLSKKLQ